MKAIVVEKNSEESALHWLKTSHPNIGDDEVCVTVNAAGVNRADLAQREGRYPPPAGASEILGLEIAGTISRIGPHVRNWKIGDRVCALLSGGGYAEEAAVHQDLLMPIPEQFSFEQAAAIPEVYLTAYVNLFEEANLSSGETLLIHGGASGVGIAAIQLARESGARVLVTVGTEEKATKCKDLGAELAIQYRNEDFAEVVLKHTQRSGVDVILDPIGGEYFRKNLRILKTKGRIVYIAALGGDIVSLPIRELMSKRARIIGSVLRSRSLEEKIAIKEHFMARFWACLTSGKIQPVIDSIVPITEAAKAHQRLTENKNIGKVILKVR